ncbi:hypothetical protein A1OE_279 [Candidatus Endolissoclinum faulkneri L2]|uniref:Uncharacterized protein n=1 Tax=Candidatus Endolissoclinum faulkneri L2 TaxID=1193729 RepID=K7YPJ4_9PROT|nr:hypothetical protein A1OE_279 [Candidatus Endolissoclinum faulkneri L2]
MLNFFIILASNVTNNKYLIFINNKMNKENGIKTLLTE